MDPRTTSFIEQLGLLTEDEGMTRTAGRIFGYLLISSGECSLDDLATALGVSRASVSTDARRLAQAGLIERRSRPGDRRDYYMTSAGSMRRWLDRRLQGLQRFTAVLRDAESLPLPDPEVRDRVERWRAFHEEALAAYTELIEHLDKPPYRRDEGLGTRDGMGNGTN